MAPFIVMIPTSGTVNPLTALALMDIGFQGTPFVMGSIETVDLYTMDIGFQGKPFVIYVGS